MARKTASTNTGGFTLEREDDGRRIFMGGKGTPKPAKDDADGDQQMYDDDADGQSYDDDSSELDDDSAEMDDDTAEMDDGGNDADDSMDDGGSDDNAQDSNLSRKKGSRRMSKKASSKKASESFDEESERVTLREQRLATQLSEMRAQMTEMRRQTYRATVEKILSGWDAGKYQFSESRIKNPDAAERTLSRTVRVELGRPARQAIERFLLSERAFRLSDSDRGEICRLFELAAKGAVDLSVRGSSFDQEERRTIRRGGQQASDPEEQEEALQQQVEAIALSEYRKPVNKLTHVELAEAQQKAADLIGYRGY